jgi:hypothetical protein
LDLAAALAKINELDSQQRETYATDATATVQLDALDAAKAAFAKTPRADAPRGNTTPTDFLPAGSDLLPVINATSLAPVDPAADFVPVDTNPLSLIDATASTFDAGSIFCALMIGKDAAIDGTPFQQHLGPVRT